MNQALIDAYRWYRQQHRNTTATRLIERAREDVAADRKRYPYSSPDTVFGGSWQRLEDMRRGDDRAYYCDNWPDGWRNHGNVGELRSDSYRHGRVVDRTGWYTEDDGMNGELLSGYVLQLPARNGKPVYVPGTANSGCDGVTLYPLDRYDDIAECARAADRYAEIEAEHERDYQRAWRAGSDAGELNRQSREIRREILQIIADLKAVPALVDDELRMSESGNPFDGDNSITRLCAIARGKVQSLLADLYKAREERDELRDNYGREAAFAEGYDD